MAYIAIKSKDGCSEALEAARRYSPNIEIVDENTLVFDLTGSKANEAAKIAEELRKKFVSVAVSENLAAALLLATWGRAREFQVSGSKLQEEGFKVQSSKFKVCNAEASDEESILSKQTLNIKPGTLNAPQAPTLNTEPGTRNSPKADAAYATYASRDACGPVEEQAQITSSKFQDEEAFQVSRSKFQVLNDGGESDKTNSSKQTLNTEPRTLNGLPLEAISRKDEFLELMDSWAVHDLGSFSQLPADEMVARFGLGILELRRQAEGTAFRAPNWNVKEDKFFWSIDLEGAIETIEPLNFVLSKGIAQIFQNLDYVGLSTQSAKITLRGREKEKVFRIRIVFPTKNQKLWIRQIVTKIELDTPAFNIDHVEIVFRSTKPRTVQNNLYSGAILEPENLNLIVTKLKKVVGLEKIGVPRLRDAWKKRFYMTEDLSPLIEEKDPQFKVQGSRFKAQEEKFKVQSSRFKVQEEKFKVQSSKFKVCNAATKAKESSSTKQTLNLEPGTLNARPADAAYATHASRDACGPVEEQAQVSSSGFQENPAKFQVSSSKFQVRKTDVGIKNGNDSEQTWNMELETLNAPQSPTLNAPKAPPVPCPAPLSFYYLPQPVKARVFFESGEPKALLMKGKRELVRTAGGPWRMDAEWYEEDEWRRDEWDIETENGAIYRVFVDKNGEAFVDGGYD